jgi:hypothetical protein
MSRSTRVAVVGGLALAAAPGLTSAAGAAQLPKLPRALDHRPMKVDITGVQSTRWTLNDPSENRCDPAVTGGGSERVMIRCSTSRARGRSWPGSRWPTCSTGPTASRS